MKLIEGRLYKDNSGNNVRLLSNYIDTAGDVAIVYENSHTIGCIGFRNPGELTPLQIDHECLKQITEPSCLLDKEVQEALKKHIGSLQVVLDGGWSKYDVADLNEEDLTYRLDPEWQPEEEKVELEDRRPQEPKHESIQEQISNINKRLGTIENKLGKFQSLRWECRR